MNVLEQFSLTGKTAIVTGGEGMMGRMICETIKELGGTAISVDILGPNPIDITVFSSCLRMAGKPCDILINNAVGNQRPSENYANRWQQDLEIGLTGALNMIQVCSDQLRKRKGVILNVGSDLSLIGPDQTLYPSGQVKPLSYSVVKAGMIGMTRFFAATWPEIRCNIICPSGIDVGQKIPRNIMGRLMRLEEMKGLIAFMVSPASSFMTGAVIPYDGGRTAI